MVCNKDSTVKDNKSKDRSYFEEFTLDFDKTHENSIKNNSFVSIFFDVVLKIQLSKITVSSYFDEFPFLCLW